MLEILSIYLICLSSILQSLLKNENLHQIITIKEYNRKEIYQIYSFILLYEVTNAKNFSFIEKYFLNKVSYIEVI